VVVRGKAAVRCQCPSHTVPLSSPVTMSKEIKTRDRSLESILYHPLSFTQVQALLSAFASLGAEPLATENTPENPAEEETPIQRKHFLGHLLMPSSRHYLAGLLSRAFSATLTPVHDPFLLVPGLLRRTCREVFYSVSASDVSAAFRAL